MFLRLDFFFFSCSTSGNIASLLKPRIKDPAGTAALAEARAVHTQGLVNQTCHHRGKRNKKPAQDSNRVKLFKMYGTDKQHKIQVTYT